MSQSLADLLAEEKAGHIEGYLVAAVVMDTAPLAAAVYTAHLVLGAGTGYSAAALGIVLADPTDL